MLPYLIVPVAFILSHLSPEKLKEPYSSGDQVVAGFEDTDVLCTVTLDVVGAS